MTDREPDRSAPTRFAHSHLLDAVPDAIVIVDANGRVARVNARAEGLFGYSRDELIGEPVELLLPERIRAQHVGDREGYGRNPHVRPMGADLDLRARHKDGHEFRVEISLSPYQTQEGPQVVCSIRDVPARHRGPVEPE